MKIPRGNKTEDIPMRTFADVANAAKKPGMKTQVFSVETPQDYAALQRLLASTVRPFSCAILTVQ